MEQIEQLLSLADHPAFLAEDGRVCAANAQAISHGIGIGTSIEDLLDGCADAWREFSGGYLSLPLLLCGIRCCATVTTVGPRQLFTLEPETADTELRMLSLAAQALREPLGDVMALVESLPNDETDERTAQISRGLHRLLRIVGNMSPHPPVRPQMHEVGALLREIWDSAQPACESQGFRFTYEPCPAPVYSSVDEGLLMRAIHNLLSNAMKFSEGREIRMQLSLHRPYYHITILDPGGASQPELVDPFTRCLRNPGLEDPRSGLGMGMQVVRHAALAHGGTVLMTTASEGGIRVTLSLPLRQNPTAVRSPRLGISYTGEHDPLLIELSDILPAEFYKK